MVQPVWSRAQSDSRLATVLLHSWWKSILIEIHWQNIKRALARLWQPVMIDHHSFPVRVSLFLGVLISLIAPRKGCRIFVNSIQRWLSAVAVCNLPSQTKVAIMLTNIRPVITENVIQFSGPGCSQMEISRSASSHAEQRGFFQHPV